MLTQFSLRESSEGSRDNANRYVLIKIGVCLTEVVRKMDTCFSGMITITFMSCWLGFVTSFYFLTCLISNGRPNDRIPCFHLTLLAFLCSYRVFFFTRTGQRLSDTMKKSLNKLCRIRSEISELNSQQFMILQENLRNQSKAPLTLFSTHSLTNSLLLSFFLTSVIILIFLVQLRTVQFSDEGPGPEASIHQINSSLVEGISKSLKKFLCERKWYCN